MYFLRSENFYKLDQSFKRLIEFFYEKTSRKDKSEQIVIACARNADKSISLSVNLVDSPFAASPESKMISHPTGFRKKSGEEKNYRYKRRVETKEIHELQ